MRRKNKYIRIDNTAVARGAYNRHDGGIFPEEVDDDLRSTKVQNILYSTFRGNDATRYGVANEGKTRQGRFVSIDEPWLAASPDGVIVNCKDSNIVGLLEVKCPFSAKSKTISEVACKSATFFLESADESCQLKHRHNYYFQIQCQLFCVNCEWCDLVVKTEMDVHIERIYRDKKWWSLQLDKLRTFYFDSLLAELACPRHRAGGIREPNH